MHKDSIKKNYLYNLAFQVVNLILPLITTPYISKTLGPENVGIYSYTYAYISSFILIGSLGIATYAQREIATSIGQEDRTQKFWEIFLVKLLTITATTILFFMFALIYGTYRFYFLIQLPYFLAAILDISWFFQGIEIFKRVSIRNILIKTIGLVLIFGLVKNKNHLYIYILILCASQVVGNLTMWINIKKYIGRMKTKKLCLSRHIKPALIYFVPTVAYQIYAVLDKAMLGILGQDILQNGYYEQAHKLINMVIMVIGSYNAVMRSRMSALFAERKKAAIEYYMIRSLHFVSFLIYPMMFGLAGIASNIVPWFFGEEYGPVIYLLVLFSPMFVVQGLRTCIGSHLITPRGSTVQAKVNYGSIISALSNVILNYLLIPRFAASGAVIASIASELIMLITCLMLTKEYVNVAEIAFVGWKYALAAVVMLIPVRILSEGLRPSLIHSVIIVVIGVCVYLAVLCVLRENMVLSYLRELMNKCAKKR